MTRNRPAPSGNRPAPSDATNVPPIVEPAGLFGVQRRAYGSVEFTPTMHGEVPASTGAQRRDLGHCRTAQTVGGEPWLGLAERWIETAAARGARFTAETIRAAVGEPPSTALVGTAVKRAQVRGLIVTDGVEIAHRPEAHGRLIRRWAAAPSTAAGVR